MSAWLHETRLLLRSRMAVIALLTLSALTALAVFSGWREMERQNAAIARVQTMQQEEAEKQVALTVHAAAGRDAGTVAYYDFHATWDAPSDTAFLALGLRDTNPYVLRVRALALQAQLHEGETNNPELALAGRLDFAFVLIYLAPLFLIALLYDLVSSERAAGRLVTLMSLCGGGSRLWLCRAALRAALVFAALVLPVLVGAAIAGTAMLTVAAVLALALAYVVFWAGLALLVTAGGWRSSANAMVLAGCWSLLTLVLPGLAQIAIGRAIPVHQGAELMLAQRQVVHGAWDEPREQTMERFFRSHPEWRDTAPLPAGFHWKWYFAFQQMGDEGVAHQVVAYRAGLLERQRWTERTGWLLPAVAVQTVLHRLARTDLPAQLQYQDEIARFHGQLRRFYYPYLFNDKPFLAQDHAALPPFKPAAASAGPAPLAGPLMVATALSSRATSPTSSKPKRWCPSAARSASARSMGMNSGSCKTSSKPPVSNTKPQMADARPSDPCYERHSLRYGSVWLSAVEPASSWRHGVSLSAFGGALSSCRRPLRRPRSLGRSICRTSLCVSSWNCRH
jgi:ABC-2 type transport system permease protein